MKKITALILALAMVFAMSVSVFAADGESTSTNTFVTDATISIPALEITLPNKAPLFINPLGFSVKIASGKAADGSEESYQTTTSQIVSPVFQITNNTPMKLAVSVKGTAAKDASATFALKKAPLETTGNTANEVFIWAYFDEVTGEGEEAALKSTPESYAKASEAKKAYAPEIDETTPTDTAVGDIPAAVDGEGGILGFKFFGEVNKNAAEEYKNGEKVVVSLAFTFKPAES